MPRLGNGMPLVSIATEAAVLAVQDFFWLNDISGELTPIHTANRTNLVTYSEDFSQWTLNGTSVVDWGVSSIGLNYYTVTKSTSSYLGVYLNAGTFSNGDTVTSSVYVKKGTSDDFTLRYGSPIGQNVEFDLGNGTIVSEGTNVVGTIQSMSDDWYRVTSTWTDAGHTRTTIDIALYTQNGNVKISGAQLEQDSRVSALIPTSGSTVTVTTPLNDTHNAWDYDSANLMLEEDPDSEGGWQRPSNVALNHDFADLGSDLITNGGFDTDSNWTKYTGWSISGGKASCDGTQSGNADLVQQNGVKGVTLDLVVGKQYKMVIDVIVSAGALSQIEVGGHYQTDDITSDGTHTVYFVPTSTNDRITITGNSTFVGSVDNVSVKQVDPNDRWTLDTGWSIEDGKLKATSTALEATQTSVFTTGNTYEVTFTVDSIASGSVKVKAGTNLGTIRTTAGTYTQVFNVQYGTSLIFDMHSSGSCVIDNVTVKEYAITPLDV